MPRPVDLPSSRVGSVLSAPVLDLRASERYCRELTRREARNFYWGFIALPRDQRIAIYALYGFARQVDDDIDLAHRNRDPSSTDRPDHARHFEIHRRRVAQSVAGSADDPVTRVLSDIIPRYGIPETELAAIVRGVEMDTQITRYESWPDLQVYCRLVASSVGRMCVRIFGFSDPAALEFADDLGMAMQLANILRDVREDLEMGRIYLPQEDLRTFGIAEIDLFRGTSGSQPAPDPGPEWEQLVAFEVQRAEGLFSSGLRVVPLIPRRAGVCVLTMAGIYQQILREIARNPRLPLQRRAALNGRSKLAVMARSWLQAM
jgi:15-cis-phytoene synthase